MKTGLISPQDWGLPILTGSPEFIIPGLDLTCRELERRMQMAINEWLPRQVEPETGAIYGFYRAADRYREPPQTVNLIASWLWMAAYDRFCNPGHLAAAVRSLEYYYNHFIVSHPMSVVAGGGCDGAARDEIWTKFSAEFAIGALGLFQRTQDPAWMERALQSGRFLVQAAQHGFSPRYRLNTGRWDKTDFGWDSWGRAVEASFGLAQATGDESWLRLALRWGEHGLSLQADNGCFYLIDEEYYNTDLAADELRAMAFLYERTGDKRFLQSAMRFAGWHLDCQKADGAWAMTVDREGNTVVPAVGPGDMPNLAIAMLRLHDLTAQEAYLQAAIRAVRYSLSRQVLPGSGQPYEGDPNVQWGFWSWDPYYDYSLSCDQATHHIRGWMFLLDYLAAKGLLS